VSSLGIGIGDTLRVIDILKKRRAQRVPAEKTSKFGHNELLLGYVEFIGVSSTINP
jgi:hypothetical protein